MITASKIKYFSIYLISIMLLVSCERNKNDVIPDIYINFTLDLYDPEFVNLNSLAGSALIDSRTNNWGSAASGYDNNGIIIYRSLPEEFNAYDRTCPYDFAVNSLSVRINIDFTQAVCPKCSTRYALSAFGTPTSGPGNYPLKNYRTSFDGRYISVWNN